MTTDPAAPRVTIATRRGVRDANMDAGTAFAADSGAVAAAVIDGIGNDPTGPDIMRLLAATAVRIGATRGPLAGLLAAAALLDDPGTDPYQPDAVAVLAVARPGRPTGLAWVGDSHIYGWDGTTLRRRTDPHTMGAFLRQNGDTELAVEHDNWVRISLSTATPTTVALAEAPATELLLLVSDGLDSVPHGDLEALVAAYQYDPEMLADRLVAEVAADADGYRDDATAVVLMPDPAATEGDGRP